MVGMDASEILVWLLIVTLLVVCGLWLNDRHRSRELERELRAYIARLQRRAPADASDAEWRRRH